MSKVFDLVPPSPLDPWEADIKALISTGKERGYLTYEELNTAAPELAPSPEMLDRILMVLALNEVEIVDGSVGVVRQREAALGRGEQPKEPTGPEKPSALEPPIPNEKLEEPVR